jgi:hypothetical protein
MVLHERRAVVGGITRDSYSANINKPRTSLQRTELIPSSETPAAHCSGRIRYLPRPGLCGASGSLVRIRRKGYIATNMLYLSHDLHFPIEVLVQDAIKKRCFLTSFAAYNVPSSVVATKSSLVNSTYFDPSCLLVS